MAKPDFNTPVLEWIAAAAGAAAIAAVLGVIIYGMFTRADAAPAFAFQTGSVTRVGQRWHVAFVITNTGDRTASAVRVVGELASGEEADVTLRYVPDRSSRQGGVFFDGDPGGGVRFSVSGYELP